jgi:hypothetical protein
MVSWRGATMHLVRVTYYSPASQSYRVTRAAYAAAFDSPVN